MLSRRFQNLPFRCSWRVRRWAATRSAAPWIAGGLERPDRQQRFSRSVDVRGWVSAPAGRHVAVDVWLGDTTLQRLVLTPAAGAPAPAGHVRSTFDAVIPLERAPSRGWLRSWRPPRSPSRRRGSSASRSWCAPGLATSCRSAPPTARSGTRSRRRSRTRSSPSPGPPIPAALAESGRSTAEDVARETGMQPTDTRPRDRLRRRPRRRQPGTALRAVDRRRRLGRDAAPRPRRARRAGQRVAGPPERGRPRRRRRRVASTSPTAPACSCTSTSGSAIATSPRPSACYVRAAGSTSTTSTCCRPRAGPSSRRRCGSIRWRGRSTSARRRRRMSCRGSRRRRASSTCTRAAAACGSPQSRASRMRIRGYAGGRGLKP